MNDYQRVAKAFGYSLRAQRKKRSISPEEIYQQFGICPESLAKMELGRPPKNMQLETICKLIAFYDCELEPLFAPEQPEPPV